MPFVSIGSNQSVTPTTALAGTPDGIVAISHAGAGVQVALGSSGTVLTSNGPTAAPTFQSASGGPGAGGVIGTAAFNPSSGAIVGLTSDGVISGVTYTSTGVYAVSFTSAQPDVKYAVSAVASDDAGAPVLIGVHGTSSAYLTTGFSLEASRAGSAFDPTVVRLTVQRLSTGIVGPTGPTGPAGGVASVNTRSGAVTLVGTDIPVFGASGGSHARGGVPDPGASGGTTKFLREDATWAVPAGAGGVTTVNTRSGAVTLVGTDIPVFVASGSSHAAGAVPAPSVTAGTNHFLREDATWDVPPTFVGDGTPQALSGGVLCLPCEDSGSTPTNIGSGSVGLTGTSIVSGPGRFGLGYQFDGFASGIAANAARLLPALTGSTGTITVCMWVNLIGASEYCLMQLNGGSPTGNLNFFVNDTSGGGSSGCLTFNVDNGSTFAFGSGAGSFYSSTSVVDGTWHFVLIELGPTTCKMYIDNALNNSASNAAQFDLPANNNLYIGITSIGGNHADGTIDEVQYFTRALTSGERTSLYTTGIAAFSGPSIPGYVPPASAGDAAAGKVLAANGTWRGLSPLDIALTTRVFG